MGEIIFITGTDTGVGKTVFTSLLLSHLRRKNVRALAMKPFCTGTRSDVKLLQSLQPGDLSDEEMNPYFFPEPLAPLVAARNVGQKIILNEVLEKIFSVKTRCETLLIEGVGGLMVPIGENFLLRDLIANLNCNVILVGQDKLGTLNHCLMSIEVMQQIENKLLAVILMERKKTALSSRSNRKILSEFAVSTPVFSIPFLKEKKHLVPGEKSPRKKIEKILASILTRV
ncbi:MAG: dethiobiotin synthase [Verrucomicrobiota bacterium]